MSLPELTSLVTNSLGRPGDPANSASTSSAHAKLDTIINRLPAFGATSVQYGSIVISSGTTGTATISSVNLSYSVVMFMGWQCASVAFPDHEFHRLVISDATTVTAVAGGSVDATTTIGFMVITFPVTATIQFGTVSGTGSGTATITSSTVAKSILINAGWYSTMSDMTYFSWVTLTNSTTVTLNGTAGKNCSMGFAIVTVTS